MSSRLGTNFWRLFATTGSANLADGVLQASAPLLAALLTRDPFAVSVISALAYLPWLLFAYPAGTLVDRVDRRRAMASANLARVVLLSGAAVVIGTGHATLPLLYLLSFTLACAETLHDTAARTLLPHVVEPASLERGNSLLGSAESVTNLFLGAPIGALLFTIAAAIPFAGTAVLYLVAAVAISAVQLRSHARPDGSTTVRRDMADGVAHLVRDPLLLGLLGGTACLAQAQAAANGVYVLYALHVMGVSQTSFGLLLAVFGGGAILGALISPVLTNSLGRATAMGLCTLMPSLGLVGMGVAPGLISGIAGAIAQAVGVAAFNVQVLTVRQAVIPQQLLGRVNGAYLTVLLGLTPVGVLAGGAIGRWWSLPGVFLAGGVLALFGTGVTWWVLLRNQGRIAKALASAPA